MIAAAMKEFGSRIPSFLQLLATSAIVLGGCASAVSVPDLASEQTSLNPTETPTSRATLESYNASPSPSALPASTSATSSAPALTPVPSVPTINVHIMIDVGSEPVDRPTMLAIMSEADRLLYDLAGIHLNLVGVEEIDLSGRNLYNYVFEDINGKHPEKYFGIHYIVVFSYGDDDMARRYGGYSLAFLGPTGYRNPFVSPVSDYSNDHIYAGVIHFGHRFGACGYAESWDEEPISEYSIDGECRNTPGLKCVQNMGYQMCPNVVDNLYASTKTFLASSSVVHELAHSFGYHGSLDHFGSPDCVEEDPRGEFTSVDEAEKWLVICPYVWDNLRESFQGYE